MASIVLEYAPDLADRVIAGPLRRAYSRASVEPTPSSAKCATSSSPFSSPAVTFSGRFDELFENARHHVDEAARSSLEGQRG